MMRSNFTVFLATILTSCLIIGPQFSSSDGVDDDFELEPIPLPDIYNEPTTVERRAYNLVAGDTRTYGVIVDCGSSGTRAHLYEWDAKHSYPELLHYIGPMRDGDEQPLSKKFSPSLSSFADSPTSELEKYIKQVLDYIESYIPRRKHPFTGVYILATAGMRLLDDDTQKRIMDDIAGYIKRHYQFAKVKTSVIPGSLEGMYQWISVNSKEKRFLNGTPRRVKTYGVIEMGGASIQVTYQLRPGVSELVSNRLTDDEAREVYRAQIVVPQISRKNDKEHNYTLHSTTFLGFGSNSARELYFDLLISKHTRGLLNRFIYKAKEFLRNSFDAITNEEDVARRNEQDEMILEDPCSPKGFISQEPLKKPQRLLESKDRILGFLMDEDEPYFTYRIRGTGNYGKCKNLVEQMLELSKKERLNCKPKEEEKCTMTLLGERFIPFHTMDFLGIGDLYHTTNLMLRAEGYYNHQFVVKRTKKICNSSYRKLIHRHQHLYNNPKLKSRLSEQCFKAVWVDTFLMKGLRMPADSDMLKTVDKINGDAPEWPLGAVMDKSLAIEEAADEKAAELYGPENENNHSTSLTLE